MGKSRYRTVFRTTDPQRARMVHELLALGSAVVVSVVSTG